MRAVQDPGVADSAEAFLIAHGEYEDDRGLGGIDIYDVAIAADLAAASDAAGGGGPLAPV